MVDVEGAVASVLPDYASYAARQCVLSLLSVASVCGHGAVATERDTSFDCFEGLDVDFVASALQLAAEPVRSMTLDLNDWLSRLRLFADEVEAMLGLQDPLPRLRSADGMFGGLSEARCWLDACAQLGIALPAVSGG